MKNSDATVVEDAMLGSQGKWPQSPSLAPVGPERARSTGTSGSHADDTRCSMDPMHQTDRYRLVTPYLSSSKDL